jgi:uncharacterized SAM-binding protein YcdF (DUF218 family)
MHHLASNIVSFFLSPLNWVFVFVIAAYFFRKASHKKICRFMAVCIFIVFGNQWLLTWYAKKWQPEPVAINNNLKYSCGIVPGGFASPDAEGKGYFNSTADRFIQAEKLYKLGIIKNILISGGNGKFDNTNFHEGAWAKNELSVMGIPDSAIFVEDRSNDTFDNAVYAKQILDSLQLRAPYLLITSAYHIPRASLIFKNAGVITTPFPCNYIEGRGDVSFSSFIPNPSVLSGWNYYLKETAGYLWYYFKKK